MSGFVVTDSEQTVTLELSVEEFAVLEHLRWHYLGGTSPARKQLEADFEGVARSLSLQNKERIDRARAIGSRTYKVADIVHEAFSA